jgi:FolB domain-containing protein
MKLSKQSAYIVLRKLEFLVFLGWGQEERALQQQVIVDLYIRFAEPPAACMTDNLTDTFCYATLNQTLKNHIERKEFRLLEHLAYDIYHHVKHLLPLETKIKVGVTKHPDQFFKSGGVTFWYSDHMRVKN